VFFLHYKVGINPESSAHPIKSRIPYTLACIHTTPLIGQVLYHNVALNAGFFSYWDSTEKGPYLYSLTQNYLLDHYSFILLSCADWQTVSGDLVVDMKKPASSLANLHLIVN